MSEVFFTRLFFNTIMSSALIISIHFLKKALKNHLSERWQYNLWFFLLIILAIPFLPSRLFAWGNMYDWLFDNLNNLYQNNPAELLTLTNAAAGAGHTGYRLQDFTLSVNRSTPDSLPIIFLAIWLTGALVLTLLTVLSNRKIKAVRKSAQPLKDETVEKIFAECLVNVGLRKKIRLYQSQCLHTPITAGLCKPYIILPAEVIDDLPHGDIKYILLHELNHCKSKDTFFNHITCAFQILYWFNPLVWFAFREMRTDREIACDISVLKMLDERDYIDYGKTIINFAGKLSQKSPLHLASTIGGTKGQIRKRIEKIASFSRESRSLNIKSLTIFILIGFFTLSQVPVISALTSNTNVYDFREDQAEYEDLSPYFNSYDGTFVLYDLQYDRYKIYNKEKSTLRVSPDSTYKIYSALYALESKIIQAEDTRLAWDGTLYPYELWNKDQDLSSAMENSVSWYFQKLDRNAGSKNLNLWFRQISYGNYDLSAGLSDYWMESSLRISPVEQVQLLKNFYTNVFNCKAANIQAVKNALLLADDNGVKLYGKTGTGTVNHQTINGWFIGYVENSGRVYFFATNIQDKGRASGSTAAKITLSILNDKNLLKPAILR